MYPSTCISQENASFYVLLIFSIKGENELWACLYYSPNFNNMQSHRTRNEYNNLWKNSLHSFPVAYTQWGSEQQISSTSYEAFICPDITHSA